MSIKDANDCFVTVTIELGHHADFLEKPSHEGFTHDWTVFVRGFEGSRLDCFVEKVVFRLHNTFKMPIRVISEPPFKVSECGYAGFLLPIDIHFKNKQPPRRISFTYDLFLNILEQPAINNVRYEKLKFQNPTPEFKAKLLKAGGVEHGVAPIPQALPDPFPSPVKLKSDKKRGLSKDLFKEKPKKKIKKIDDSPLSSLSSSSGDEEERPPPKKSKENSPKQENSVVKKDSLSKEKTSSKFKLSSFVKESISSEKEREEKPVKHKSKDKNKDRDKEKSSSSKHKHKEHKKEKDVSVPHKSKDTAEQVHKSKEMPESTLKSKEAESHKEKESSNSSSKSLSSSSHSDKKHIGSSSGNKDKHAQKDKDSKEKESGKHKERHNSSSRDKELGNRDREVSSKDKDSNNKCKESNKDKLSSSIKEKESRTKDKDSSFKEKESGNKDRESSNKEKESSNKDKESSIKDKESSNKDKESSIKDKESNNKDKESSNKDKESSNKDKESSSKDKESSNKNKVANIKDKDASNISSKEKERNKERDSSIRAKDSSSKTKDSSIKEKDKIKKDKSSSHKSSLQSSSSVIDEPSKKIKDEFGKERRDKDRNDKKSQKRRMESPVTEEQENKKLKSTPPISTSLEEKLVNPKLSPEKEKNNSMIKCSKEYKPESQKESKFNSPKETKASTSLKERKSNSPSESKPSSTEKKSGSPKDGKCVTTKESKVNAPKEAKCDKSDVPKDKHGIVAHISNSKPKSKPRLEEDDPPQLKTQSKKKHIKSESFSSSEKLALTADLQPQLLLSPLKSQSDDNLSEPPSPHGNEGLSILPPKSRGSNLSTSVPFSSQHESQENTDSEVLKESCVADHSTASFSESDSDYEEELSTNIMPEVDGNKELNNQKCSVQSSDISKAKKNTETCTEIERSMFHKEDEVLEENTNSSNATAFYPKHQGKKDKDDKTSPVAEKSDSVDNLDILAPNGVPIRELITINEKIELAQQEEDQNLLEKVIDIIGDTDDFDLDDTGLMFDICSVDKNVIFQIQDILRL